MSNTNNQLVPLTEAAFHLRVSYLAARDMLLRGELQGEKHDGRWYVEESSIARNLKDKQAD